MAASNFQKKASGFLVTALIGLIVISFMFSGYQSFQSSGGSVGKVGDYEISAQEYQNQYSRMVSSYSKMMGGKNLSSKDIERFAIKKQALKGLIDMKLRLNLTDFLSINPSSSEVASQIKDLPYFKENEVFNLAKYKNILAANRMTPTSFEKTVIEDMKIRSFETIYAKVPLSNSYVEDVKKFKNQKYNAQIIQFKDSELIKNIKVTSSEIKKFMSNVNNKNKLEKLFDEKKSTFEKPARAKARHLLLKSTPENDTEVKNKITNLAKKITAKNFIKMANKHTEDPSGKKNGGDLGWFTKGKMVKEFETAAFTQKIGTVSKPIKTNFGYHLIYVENREKKTVANLKDHQKTIAKELIQEEKKGEVAQLVSKITSELKTILDNGGKAANKYAKKHNLTYEENQNFNRLDGYAGKIQLGKEFTKEILNTDLKNQNVFVINKEKVYTLTRVTNKEITKEDREESEKYAVDGQGYVMNKSLISSIVGELEKKISVKIQKQIQN